MRNFTCVQDLGDLRQALAEAFEIKKIVSSLIRWGRIRRC